MNRRTAAVTALALFTLAGVGAWTAPTPAPVPAESAAAAFRVDSVHSSLLFKIKHKDVAWFYGRFNGVKGSWNLDPAAADSGSVEITIDTQNVDTGNAKRDDHLRSPDFFSAKEFPTITFKSTSVASTGENSFEVTGDLSLHGVTKRITVPVEITGKTSGGRGELAGILSTFTFNRSEFGMSYMVGGGLGDEVTIIASLEGGAAKE